MKTDAHLRSKVMRRVYLMYCGRQICKPIPRLVIFGVLALALVGSVSIVNVIANALNTAGFAGLVTFALSAFTEAETTVKVVSIALAGMIGWAALDTARKIHIVPAHQESLS